VTFKIRQLCETIECGTKDYFTLFLLIKEKIIIIKKGYAMLFQITLTEILK